MDLSHRLLPHVVVTDQGSAFMSQYFRDFLAGDQIRPGADNVADLLTKSVTVAVFRHLLNLARCVHQIP